VVSKSTDKRSTHFDAKLLQITGTEFVEWRRQSKAPNELSAVRQALNYPQILPPLRSGFGRSYASLTVNVLRQTQTAYNRFKFPETSPKASKDSK
jgi:hypothetical protein